MITFTNSNRTIPTAITGNNETINNPSYIDKSFREQSFLMLGTRAEKIFEVLKKFLSPGSILQKVLVPQHDLSKCLGPLPQSSKQLKTFLCPFYSFTIVFIPLTLNKKNSKEFNSFLKSCFKMILIFKNNTSPDTMKAP